VSGAARREPDAQDAAARELTLMLAYLASWEEGPHGARRCWKGFRFEDPDALAEQRLVEDSRRARSLYLTPDGQRRARELLAEHGFDGFDVEATTGQEGR
jgi:hypothetical protein